VVGLSFPGEHLNWIKALSLTMIVAGVVGLNLAGVH
jgi:small multidrug resistance pump